MCSPIGYFISFLFFQSKNLLFFSFSFFCPHSLNFWLLRIIYLFFLNIFFLRCLFFEELAMNFYILLYIILYIIILYKSIYSVVYISQSFHLCLFLKMQNLREITFNTMQSIRFKLKYKLLSKKEQSSYFLLAKLKFIVKQSSECISK